MQKIIYKIENETVKELYFVGLVPKSAGPASSIYAFYASKSGHFPERVYTPKINAYNGDYFTDVEQAVKKTVRLLDAKRERLLKLLELV